jgi:hypothetical protein
MKELSSSSETSRSIGTASYRDDPAITVAGLDPALFTDDVHPVEAGEGLADCVITEQVGDGVVGAEHDVEPRSVNLRAPTHVRDREVNGEVALSSFATSALHGSRR